MQNDLQKQNDLAKREGVALHVVKVGRKYHIEGDAGGWVTRRSFPAKWKAEIALEAFKAGGTFRTYCAKMNEADSQRMAAAGCGPFQKGSGNWTQYRELPSLSEVNFHFSEYGRREEPYENVMADVRDAALAALIEAQEDGDEYVLFIHGSSTSRPSNTTARSQIRKLMRSKESTPYICRRKCIQHTTVFVAAIRPKSQNPSDGVEHR